MKNHDLEEVKRLLALGVDPDASEPGHEKDSRDGACYTALAATEDDGGVLYASLLAASCTSSPYWRDTAERWLGLECGGV